MNKRRDVFSGHIMGVGSSSGIRVVVGMWQHSPLGAFADCMVATAQGRRILLAPNDEVAEYVSQTYQFEEVRVAAVTVERSDSHIAVDAAGLQLQTTIAGRTALGMLLHAIPRTIGARPAFAILTDPDARVVMSGVRTRRSAGNGRREYYAPHDLHAVTACAGSFDQQPLGTLAPVAPEPNFGFSSTPRSPALTSVTTTVLVPS